MNREAIATGSTVEEAKEKACLELGVETYDDNVEMEIIEMPSKKFFGLFGSTPYKVRVFIKTTPAQAALDYLESIIKAMGLTDIQMSVEEKDIIMTKIDAYDIVSKRFSLYKLQFVGLPLLHRLLVFLLVVGTFLDGPAAHIVPHFLPRG